MIDKEYRDLKHGYMVTFIDVTIRKLDGELSADETMKLLSLDYFLNYDIERISQYLTHFPEDIVHIQHLQTEELWIFCIRKVPCTKQAHKMWKSSKIPETANIRKELNRKKLFAEGNNDERSRY